MPHALLWDADIHHADKGFLHFITDVLKVSRSAVKHSSMVSPNALDVFDHQVSRPEHFSGSDHDEIQLVLLVLSASVVVEIRVPLARRTSNEDVDLAHFGSRSLLRSGRRSPDGTVEPRADISSLSSHARPKIEVVDTPNVLVPLHCEPHFEAPPEAAASLGDSEGEPAGAREEVNQPDRVMPPLVRGAHRPTEENVVVAVNFVQRATHRFVTPAFTNRRLTASGALSSHCHTTKTL
nr:hypothetical protein [Hyalangium minutum]